MAIVFLLGPSQWASEAARDGPAPMDVRRRLGTILEGAGHHVVVMEDVPDRQTEDLVDKFDRILAQLGVTDVVVYWPRGAKMQTTYDELVLLRDRAHRPGLPTIWVLHHRDVARIDEDRFQVDEAGGRSRYLEAVARSGVNPFAWQDEAELTELVRCLALEL